MCAQDLNFFSTCSLIDIFMKIFSYTKFLVLRREFNKFQYFRPHSVCKWRHGVCDGNVQKGCMTTHRKFKVCQLLLLVTQYKLTCVANCSILVQFIFYEQKIHPHFDTPWTNTCLWYKCDDYRDGAMLGAVVQERENVHNHEQVAKFGDTDLLWRNWKTHTPRVINKDWDNWCHRNW